MKTNRLGKCTPASALALAAIATVLLVERPSVATGNDVADDASSMVAAVAPVVDPEAPMLLQLPPVSAGPIPGHPTVRGAGDDGGRAVERPVVPHDLALRLLDPDRMMSRPPTVPVSGPPDADKEPSAVPAVTPEPATISDPPPASTPSTSPAVVAPPPVPPDDVSPPDLSPASTGEDPVRMVTIPLGQSRRWTLDHQATAVIAAVPEIADVRLLSPNLLYVIGRGVGRTSLAVLDDQGLIDEWLVTTILDLQPVHELLAGEPVFSEVNVRQFSRGVALTGEVESVAVAERARRLVAAVLPEGTILENEIHVRAPQQVNLEVQIAEVQRSVTESLGISWEAFNTLGRSSDLLWRIGRPLGSEFALDASAALGAAAPDFVEGQPTSSLVGRFRGRRGAVQGVVDALASAGLANVLARPNLTAISGETASFFSGGEYPLPVGFRDGVILFEYKKYGVLLDFVPTVVDPGRITLKVRPEVSETSDTESLVTVGTEIPVINVRRAETTVELGSGESIVIAGLFRSGSNTVESGLPGLKDLPVFGLLFRQDRVEASETELIVVVTVNLVRSGAARPRLPADTAPTTRQVHGYHF